MKINKTFTALVAGASLGLSGQAIAAGTPSGTSITNTATLSYKVNSTDIPSTSSQAKFAVDTKVDLTLSSTNSPSADAGATVDLTYTLTNDSNSPQFFKLDSDQASAIFNDSGDTLITDSVISLAIDASFDFKMPGKVADTAGNTSTTTYQVRAKAVTDATGATFLTEESAQTTPADKDASQANLDNSYIVFAEAITDSALPGTLANGIVRDGGFVVSSGITVDAPELTSTKTVTVNSSTITDSNGDTFSTSYAIPGSTVSYTVVVTNVGAKTASGVNFSDDIATNSSDLDTESVTNIVIKDNSNATLASGFSIVSNAHTPVPAGDNDGGTAGIIDITLPDILPNEKLTVSFDINIK